MSEIDNVLSQRLFGYGIPYEVEIDSSGKFSPVKWEANVQALELSKTLESWSREGKNYSVSEPGSSWAYSMPFGRCGIAGLPLEHLQVFDAEEIHIDVLSEAGLERKLMSEDDIKHFKKYTADNIQEKFSPIEFQKHLDKHGKNINVDEMMQQELTRSLKPLNKKYLKTLTGGKRKKTRKRKRKRRTRTIE